ncbi:response regulator [Emticicia sp. C21]|uniref:response regulator n=1 Tax=Emticicia sp. C21 TaxID=2302915 RepID=UPI000E345A3F|nr:response regulator [Emticicia sp. C21]RFS13325.1 response regulator [Emticicia sp. C21]
MQNLIATYSPIKILLAEDDLDDQFIFSDTIKQLSTSIELTIVNDGQGVLDVMRSNNNFIPHIIFLDVNMPKMNGIECLIQIRRNKILKNTPCIILTTSTAPKDIEETYNHGANLYFEKPIGYTDFVKMFNKLFEVNWADYFPPKRESFFIAKTYQ